MMPEISVAIFHNYPILAQLQLEEALLRADERNWCLINFGSPAAIVMGISGKPETLIDTHKWYANPIPIIKRFSGGGTVFVDEQTIFVTFICNASSTVPPFPQQVMQWNQRHFSGLFEQPIFALQENDYTIENKKFGGNAQYLTKKRWLQHSTLLWDFRKDSMQYLLHPPKTPQYRQNRSHLDFLCCLKDYLLKPEKIQEHILSSISHQFTLRDEHPSLMEKVGERPHRRSTERITLYVPNKETAEALDATERGEGIVMFDSIDEFFDSMEE